ncbi:hypothetical protein FRC10_010016 [Ceratobasidium sp. 414]|nr:hypothetical protein FRC10_010016 [Ceratobasidium sp. 414]
MSTANCPNPEGPLAKILTQSALQPMPVLNDALDMAYDSRNLQAFADPQIVPSCMHLMMLQPALLARKSPREMAARKANLEAIRRQEGAYTLMCAQIISVSLQVNLLGEDGVNEYLEALSGASSAPTHGPAFLFAFSSHVARVIHNKFTRASQILSEMFKNKNAAPTESVSLPSLDSLGQMNAELLLWFLYDERDLILAARHEVPTCWQGWSVLLYQLWIYMRGVNITNRLTVFLRDLICRFGLIDSGDPNEENLLLLLETHLKDTSGDGFNNERNRPMDYDDARTITEAYTKRFSSDSPPSMKFSVSLVRWILPGLSEKDCTRCMLLSVVDASLKRVWRAIEGVDGPLDNEQKGLIIEFTQNLFMDVQAFLKDKRVKESQKLALVEILEKHELLDLAGRVMLIFTIGGLTKVNLALCKKLATLIIDRRECFEQTFEGFSKRHVATQAEFNGWARVLVHTRRMSGGPWAVVWVSPPGEDGLFVRGLGARYRMGRYGLHAKDAISLGIVAKSAKLHSPVDNHKAACEELSTRRRPIYYTGKRQEIGKYDETWIKPEGEQGNQDEQESSESSETGSSKHDSSEISSDDSETSYSDHEPDTCEEV